MGLDLGWFCPVRIQAGPNASRQAKNRLEVGLRQAEAGLKHDGFQVEFRFAWGGLCWLFEAAYGRSRLGLRLD